MTMKTICANCEIKTTWKPTIINGKSYCCEGCAEGGPCICDYAQLPPLPIRFIRFEFVVK